MAGGLTSLPPKTSLASAGLERFDPKTGQLHASSLTLRQARWAHTASLLSDGRVLLVGGFGQGLDGSPSRSVEEVRLLDGGVLRVRSLGQLLADPRAGHSATVMRSGMLLVAGGLSVVLQNKLPVVKPADTAEVFVY